MGTEFNMDHRITISVCFHFLYTEIYGIEFICTPAQHFSGRNPFGQNSTLWASWVLRGPQHSFYFGGDSGYFPGYPEIGDAYGPFDAVALPIGSYKPRWFMSPVHMDPAEAVQAYLDLKGRIFIPIHWGTFQLSDEPLDEPPVTLLAEVKRHNLNEDLFWILKHGETRILEQKKTAAETSLSGQ